MAIKLPTKSQITAFIATVINVLTVVYNLIKG